MLFLLSRGRSETSEGEPIGADFASALFTEEGGGPWAFQANYVSPPDGACIVYEGRGAQAERSTLIAYSPPVRELDAGELILGAEATELLISRLPAGLPGYLDFVGQVSRLPDEESPSLLEPGSIRLQGAGGDDVGAFEVGLTMPPEPQWTNRRAVAVVSRSQGVTLNWTASTGPDQTIWVAGGATDPASDAQAQFVCPLSADRGSFTVGPEVLARLPPGNGYLAIAILAPPAGVEFAASGLDFAAASAASSVIELMEYQ